MIRSATILSTIGRGARGMVGMTLGTVLGMAGVGDGAVTDGTLDGVGMAGTIRGTTATGVGIAHITEAGMAATARIIAAPTLTEVLAVVGVAAVVRTLQGEVPHVAL